MPHQHTVPSCPSLPDKSLPAPGALAAYIPLLRRTRCEKVVGLTGERRIARMLVASAGLPGLSRSVAGRYQPLQTVGSACSGRQLRTALPRPLRELRRPHTLSVRLLHCRKRPSY